MPEDPLSMKQAAEISINTAIAAVNALSQAEKTATKDTPLAIEGTLKIIDPSGKVLLEYNRRDLGILINGLRLLAHDMAGLQRRNQQLESLNDLPDRRRPMDKEFFQLACQRVEAVLPDETVFILFTLMPGPTPQRIIYTSNGQRHDVIAMIKEWLINYSGPEEWLNHIQ